MRKHYFIFTLFVKQTLTNTKELIGLSIFLITCMIIFSHLWEVAAMRTGNVDPEMLLWYIAFNQWVLISIPEMHIEVQEEREEGSLAYTIARPISYPLAKFTEGFARLVVQLVVLGIVTFVFSYFWTQALPLTLPYMALALFFGLLAGCLGLLFQILIGLFCFWMHDVGPIHWIWDKLLFVLGGLILPLMAYPEWLKRVASFTPFPLILGGRSALLFHQTPSDALMLLVQYGLWLAIACFLVQAVYRRALTVLQVAGG